ncbi:MAG TPA: hypothetical protein VMW20_03315 [Candidatus Nanoarchaeia archaeon]|nr:hypothetical protein [Candidatus Nanoarchaeia archaeon]
MKHTFFEKYPALKISPKEQEPFIELADIIIAKKERGDDTTTEEKQIDQLIYKTLPLDPRRDTDCRVV